MIDNNIFTTTLYFGKKDKDLSIWVQSIPKGLFSYHIRCVIKAFLTKDENFIFPTFNVENIKPKNIYKPLSIPSDPDNKIVYDFVITLNSTDENILGYKIKEIIRYYMQRKIYDLDIPISVNKKETYIKEENEKDIKKINVDPLENEDNELTLLLKQTQNQNG